MNQIPIRFEHLGRQYTGKFGIVMGGGHTSTFHLMDSNNYYLGRLRYSEFLKGWAFDPTPKAQELEELGDYFGDYIQ